MKPVSLRVLLHRWHEPMMLHLTALPLLLLAACHLCPDHLFHTGALALAAALLAALCISLPGRVRRAVAAVSAAALAALGMALLPLSTQPLLAALPILTAGVMLASLPLAGRQVSDTPPALYFAGVGSHLFAYAMIALSRGTIRAQLDTALPVLTAAFAAYLLLLLLSLNRISLDNATMARCPLPASMRRANTLLTLALLALSMIIASLPIAVRLLLSCRDLLLGALRTAFTLLSRLLPAAPGAGNGGMGAPMMQPGTPGAEFTEPSLFTRLMEEIMIVFTYLVLIIGTLLLIRLLVRLALRVIRIIAARLALYSAAVSGDYVDEITDTREEDGRSTSYAARIRKRFSPSAAPDEPGARIRWRYARLLKHRNWADSSTARENLPQEAAALYERARYSNLPVGKADAEQFDKQVQKL